jgi:hypothetical protein
MDLHPSLQTFLVAEGDALGAFQLGACGDQPVAIHIGPAVVLGGGQLHVVGLEGDGQLQDLLHLVLVVPVQDEAQYHGISVAFDRAGHRKLVPEGVGAGDEVVELLAAGLEADLDVVQPGLAEGRHARLAKRLDPVLGAELIAVAGEVHRIGAIGALQRTLVGELRQQPQGQGGAIGCGASRFQRRPPGIGARLGPARRLGTSPPGPR